MQKRKPLALANWKMAMSVAESLAYIKKFQTLAGDMLEHIEVVICPAYTALWPVAQALRGSYIQLGAQNLAATSDIAHTGQISAALLAEVGCAWVMVGHWEVRRHLGDDHQRLNRKVHLAFEAGLRPVLLVGERRGEAMSLENALSDQLSRVLDNCQPSQVSRIAFVYEPEAAIGVAEPAAPESIAAGCGFLRRWLASHYGLAVGEQVRIIYGGSVTPEHASSLLAYPDIDGLGASRKGRDPEQFSQIVRQIFKVKGASGIS